MGHPARNDGTAVISIFLNMMQMIVFNPITIFQGFFEIVADDYITMDELEDFAQRRIHTKREQEIKWSDFLVERIQQVRELENRPIIRAHIGIAADSIEPTVEAVEMLADAECMEIVSLAPEVL